MANPCNGGGYLVGAGCWLPSEPFDFYRAGYRFGAIGCNHLICSRCGRAVRHALEGESRRYRCDCVEQLERTYTQLDTSSERDPDWTPPWRCAGHPTFVPPGVVAGIEVGARADWPAIVAAHIADPTRLHPSLDRIPGFVLTRVYQALEHEHDRRALANAVGRHGGDASPTARQAVALFYALNLHAPGLERVLDAWRADPSLYDERSPAFHERPMDPLLDVVAGRIARREDLAAMLETWRWAALRGTGLGDHVYTAALIDAEWTAEHVEELLDRSPSDWAAVVHAIRVDPMRLVPGLQRAIAEGHATREKVEPALIERYGPSAAAAIAAIDQA